MYLNSTEKLKIKNIKIKIKKINKSRNFKIFYTLKFNINNIKTFEKICIDNKLHNLCFKKWENERIKYFKE